MPKKAGWNILNHYKKQDMAQNSNKKRKILLKRIWSDEIMVNCDVICGRTKQSCGVPSLPRTGCHKV